MILSKDFIVLKKSDKLIFLKISGYKVNNKNLKKKRKDIHALFTPLPL